MKKNNVTLIICEATTSAPPNHMDGRIQDTIADEKGDAADEAFGQAVR